jgi:hypothetical protein
VALLLSIQQALREAGQLLPFRLKFHENVPESVRQVLFKETNNKELKIYTVWWFWCWLVTLSFESRARTHPPKQNPQTSPKPLSISLLRFHTAGLKQ